MNDLTREIIEIVQGAQMIFGSRLLRIEYFRGLMPHWAPELWDDYRTPIICLHLTTEQRYDFNQLFYELKLLGVLYPTSTTGESMSGLAGRITSIYVTTKIWLWPAKPAQRADVAVLYDVEKPA